MAFLHLEAWVTFKSLGSGSPSFGGQQLLCESIGSGSFSFRGQRLSVSRLGETPLHLEAGGYL
jgi:hypothetical protein